jgi:hypothetical protein
LLLLISCLMLCTSWFLYFYLHQNWSYHCHDIVGEIFCWLYLFLDHSAHGWT